MVPPEPGASNGHGLKGDGRGGRCSARLGGAGCCTAAACHRLACQRRLLTPSFKNVCCLLIVVVVVVTVVVAPLMASAVRILSHSTSTLEPFWSLCGLPCVSVLRSHRYATTLCSFSRCLSSRLLGFRPPPIVSCCLPLGSVFRLPSLTSSPSCPLPSPQSPFASASRLAQISPRMRQQPAPRVQDGRLPCRG